MRIGISPFASTRDGVLRLAREAVEGRMDTLWLGDGMLENPDFPSWAGGMESFVELGWLAGRFPDARIGITAAVLPLRDIDWVVKQAATLDHITEGEFVLAVAPGFWEREFEFRGRDFATRGHLFDEALKGLLARWQEDNEGGRLSPIPLTPGGPDVWLAGARATMLKAIALRLPWQASRISPADLRPVAAEFFDRGGRELAVRVRMELGPDHEPGKGVAWNVLSGSPPALAEHLSGYAEVGVSDVSIVPGQDDETSLRTVEALGEHVIPQLAGIV